MSAVARLRLALGGLVLLGVFAICLPAAAQQPSSVNPTADAVKEDKLLGQLKRAETRERRVGEYVAMLARGETIHPQR